MITLISIYVKNRDIWVTIAEIQFLTMRHMGHHTFTSLAIRDIWVGHDDPYVVKSYVHT